MFGSFGNKKNSVVRGFGCEKVGSGLWAVNVLLLIRISVTGCHENGEYAVLQYIKMTHSIDTGDGILGCICLGCSTDDEVDHAPRRDTCFSEQRRISV